MQHAKLITRYQLSPNQCCKKSIRELARVAPRRRLALGARLPLAASGSPACSFPKIDSKLNIAQHIERLTSSRLDKKSQKPKLEMLIIDSNLITLLDLCVSSLRRGHANLLRIVPILTDAPRRESTCRIALLLRMRFGVGRRVRAPR